MRENQLACLPFARSGRAEALLFDKYPELAEKVERSRRAKVDAIVLSNKFSEGDATASSSFRAQSLEELSISPLKQRARRRASRDARGETESPGATPMLKGRGSVSDLMFEMSDGEEDEDVLGTRIRPPQFTGSSAKTSDHPADRIPASWEDNQDTQKVPSPHALGTSSTFKNLHANSSTPKSTPERNPVRPWGATPLSGAKLDLKDIMAQTPNDKPSNLSLGLSQQEKEERTSGSFHARLSQKERKRLQQSQQMGAFAPTEKTQPVPPTVSPWQAVSHRKPSSTSAPVAPPQPSRTSSTPHLTMRQTVANRGAASKQKEKQDQPESSSVAAESSPSQKRTVSSSERGMSVSTTPIPTPHSVRHIPLPSHSPSSPSQHLSMMEILSLQQAEKDYVRDAAAKRSLQEIQQEQEFQQWWDQESKRVMQEEKQRKRADERAAKASRAKNKPRGGRGRGKGKKESEDAEQGKGSRDVSVAPTSAGASVPASTPKNDQSEKGKNRGKGHRGGRGGGRGGRPQGPARESAGGNAGRAKQKSNDA